MRFFVAGAVTPTNSRLVRALAKEGLDAVLLPVEQVVARARPGDAVLPRVDVTRELDGAEPGLELLDELELRDVQVLTGGDALLATHDKLRTARVLEGAGVRHPRTTHATDAAAAVPFPGPVVVKPRFGSWGRDVVRCDSPDELGACLRRFATRRWFRAHGALVQELIPPRGHDLRIVVAGGEAVGAIARVAADGEWRTNVALGGRRMRVEPSADAVALALDAARTLPIGLVGVDLLPAPDGHVVVELNGCVDFTGAYTLPGSRNVFAEVAARLAALAGRGAERWDDAPAALAAV